MKIPGIWWKHVDMQVLMDIGLSNSDTVVSHKGVAGAVSKDFSQQWRRKQPWMILRVLKSGSFGRTPYHIYFSSSDGNMIFRKKVVVEFIAVRIGSIPIVFGIKSAYPGPELEQGRVLEQWSDVFLKEKGNEKHYPLEKRTDATSQVYRDFVLSSDVLFI